MVYRHGFDSDDDYSTCTKVVVVVVVVAIAAVVVLVVVVAVVALVAAYSEPSVTAYINILAITRIATPRFQPGSMIRLTACTNACKETASGLCYSRSDAGLVG